jgi:hypothetical protein
MLQSATNADSVQMAFLADETNYQAVRALQLKNLIIPVVGDFGGPSAIRSVGSWLRNREMTVTAFYLSNVEQYLFRENGASDRFYANVSSLPVDSTSQFIRSVPRTSGMNSIMTFGPMSRAFQAGTNRLTYTRDSSGNVVTQMIRDSAGVMLVQTAVDSSRKDTLGAVMQKLMDSLRVGRTLEVRKLPVTTIPQDTAAIPRDSLGALLKSRRDSIARANTSWQIMSGPTTSVLMGGLLTSGTAPIQATLKAFFLGELKGYGSIIQMTKISQH